MKFKVILMLLISIIFTSAVTASSINGDYSGKPIVTVSYMGKELKVEDIPAMIDDGRTMVPLYLLKQLGYELSWDGGKYSVDIKPTTQAVNRQKLSSQEIAKLSDRVGMLLAYNQDGKPISQGTGFVVNKEGLMISCYHVIKGTIKYLFENYGRSTMYSTDFRSIEKDVIGVTLNRLPENTGKTFSYIPYSSKLPEVGDKIYAIGYPGGILSISDGYVSKILQDNGKTTIIHNAKVAPGSSGGALINEYGEAIGITSSENFAIPMIYVQQEIDKIKQ